MKQVTCIFLGKSGSGKGTQSDLLIKHLEKVDSKIKAVYVETGQKFRDFMHDSKTYTASRIKEDLDNGKLMPEFLAIWLWSSALVEQVTGKEHLVFDGVARRIEEAPLLEAALQFLKREKIIVVFIDIHHEVAKKRLLKRGRHDDKEEKINERLSWFDTHAMQSVHYFKKSEICHFVHINGDQSIEDTHKDILEALGV